MRADVIKAMMDPEFEFKIGDEVIKAKGELLSLTAKEAIQTFGDPPHAASRQRASQSPSTSSSNANPRSRRFHRPLEGHLVRATRAILTAFTPILLGIGMLGLFIEFKTPGFGIFGLTGIVLLGIVFFGHYVAGLSGHEPAAVLPAGRVAGGH
jgi:membrane-bound serine protease (ClpP class)